MSVKKGPESKRILLGSVLVFLATAVPAPADECPGEVWGTGKISESQGGFTGQLDTYDWFGVSTTLLGDLDGDGVREIAVGAGGDDDGGGAPTSDRGAVWVMFMNSDGTVASHTKISDTAGGFTGLLGNGDYFGSQVSWLGDLGSCAPTPNALAVSAYNDDDGGTNRGAVYILFLQSDGTVASHTKISSTSGGPGLPIVNGAQFGYGLKALNDRDEDGIPDLAVGAILESSGGGAWLLYLNCDGTVREYIRYREGMSGFPYVLDNFDWFGASIADLGDVNGDGIGDIAIGSPGDDDGGGGSIADRGAIYVLFLDEDDFVQGYQKISRTAGNFGAPLGTGDYFAASMDALPDLDGNGVRDLVAGTRTHDLGGTDIGAIWVLFLEGDGTVKSYNRITESGGYFPGNLDAQDQFGYSVTSIGDCNSDGLGDIAVGALYDDDGGSNQGGVWMAFLDSSLVVEWEDETLVWGPFCGATNYDVITGTLDSLMSHGSFSGAVEGCVENNLLDPWLEQTDDPDPGDAVWFLIRRVFDSGPGTYDTCSESQRNPRDFQIALDGSGCP